jgi:dipeptidyl aminopeptidase/acylaminoacyl peptidase
LSWATFPQRFIASKLQFEMLKIRAFFLIALAPLLAQKRPLNHNDYDGWKHIQNQQLSNDGRYLAFAIFPQQGDGEVIVRDLKTGKEFQQPVGGLPPPSAPNFASPQMEDTPPPPPGLAIKFAADSSAVVFSTFPKSEDTEAAKRAKAKPEAMPKGDLVIMQLPTGEVFRTTSIKSFELPTQATGYVAYLQLLAPQKSITPEHLNSTTPKPKKSETGDLILRNLKTGAERKFLKVSEYSLTNDGKLLVFASADKDASGVFESAPDQDSSPKPLLAGKGHYEKLTWDEDQKRLAFVSDRDDVAAKIPAYKLYTWDHAAATAREIASAKTPGLSLNWVIAEAAPITLSKGGTRIFFGTAPRPAPPPAPDKTPADEKVSVDLWSWRDDYIQPMQKVRARVERNRSYRAVFDLAAGKLTQLADLTMPEAMPSEDGRYALGFDDRPYRREQEYDERFEDVYFIDTTTGARKLALQKDRGRISWAPDSEHAIFYNGKDWLMLSAPDGTMVNLTAKLGVSFGREDYDLPSNPTSYGLGGWTKNGKYVLIYDRYDIWRITPDGRSAVKLTEGRKDHLTYRVIHFTYGEPGDRWINTAQPLLLRAESDDTHDSGFYRVSIDAKAAPDKLLFGPNNFAPAIKARDAETYVTAASRFNEFPDLLVTDGSFRDLQKVTNLGSQMAEIAWGTSELVQYRNADGMPLKAILYKPENFDPHKKYPMLVYLYERLTQNVNNFIEPRPTNVISPTYYVSNGYLVLEPDISYKIGYPGQSALDCVLPAVQEMVDKGFVDEKHIGIQGHSWGGYQIAYMVTQTNRFRAAAPGAPVADMISAYDGIRWGPGIPRQFQYERTQSRIGGSLWQYPMRYIENSPIFMVDRIQTPLLMLHNDADDAVPWYQGIEFYLALRRLDKEVYFFSYNGEPHNLRRRANQKDYTMRMQQFFDYYLKGAAKPAWMDTGIPFIDKQSAVLSDTQ